MPVRKLHGHSNPAEIAQGIIRAHPSLLAPHLVSAAQVERLIGRLVEHRRQQQAQLEQPQAEPLGADALQAAPALAAGPSEAATTSGLCVPARAAANAAAMPQGGRGRAERAALCRVPCRRPSFSPGSAPEPTSASSTPRTSVSGEGDRPCAAE